MFIGHFTADNSVGVAYVKPSIFFNWIWEITKKEAYASDIWRAHWRLRFWTTYQSQIKIFVVSEQWKISEV